MAQQPFKDWKTFAEQIDLLEQRGMVFHDKAQAEKELARIGYYRLSAYWYPFRQYLATGGRDDVFVANTQFDDVIALYDFDNAIKILALEAIQHIEIAMRTQFKCLAIMTTSSIKKTPKSVSLKFRDLGTLGVLLK